MRWPRQVAPVLSTMCVGYCIVVGLLFWFTPLRYSGTSNGDPAVWDRSFAEGSSFGALPLVIPVLIAALGAWAAWRGQRLVLVGTAILLAVFTSITGFSIGQAYIPATGVLLLAGLLAFVLGSGRPKVEPTMRVAQGIHSHP